MREEKVMSKIEDEAIVFLQGLEERERKRLFRFVSSTFCLDCGWERPGCLYSCGCED